MSTMDKSERAAKARELSRERRRLGITQTAVACRAGISAAALCRYELGSRCPELPILRKWERSLATEARRLRRRVGAA